ncbi:putative necrosis-inducing factor-domain-containing protein [Panaeolus papilionaceus]|nr:putative necrosis-inducing factor-domain-containing protein [Panaeolus papilionaceus]
MTGRCPTTRYCVGYSATTISTNGLTTLELRRRQQNATNQQYSSLRHSRTMFTIVQALTLAAAFLVVVNGTPVDVTPTEQLYAIKRSSEDRCDPSTIIDQTSGASPNATDCSAIAKSIAGGGSWSTPPGEQHELFKYGECHFGVRSLNSSPFGPNFVVGNKDIIDNINDSIKGLQSVDGRIGAKGVMKCGLTRVEWTLLEYVCFEEMC